MAFRFTDHTQKSHPSPDGIVFPAPLHAWQMRCRGNSLGAIANLNFMGPCQSTLITFILSCFSFLRSLRSRIAKEGGLMKSEGTESLETD